MSFVQLCLLFPLIQMGKLATPVVECPVEEHANYTIKGKRTYPHAVYYSCNGCFGQETFGRQYCRLDGSRDGEPLPNCSASCLNSDTRCTAVRHHNCEFYPQTYWEYCGKTCDSPALCHRDSGETDCQCGTYAQKKKCETDENIRLSICPYTCSLRESITCGDPNGLFPNVVARLTTTAHWLDKTSFTCEEGYINMGTAFWIACNITGKWILNPSINPPHCVPKDDYGTFRSTLIPSLRLELIKNTTAESETFCARVCSRDVGCTHFTYDGNLVCRSFKYPRWKSTGINLSNQPVWQRVLPTEYKPNTKLP